MEHSGTEIGKPRIHVTYFWVLHLEYTLKIEYIKSRIQAKYFWKIS
jgi:hypothetical protein